MVFLNKVEFMVVGILIKHFLKNRRKLSYFNIERFREFPSRLLVLEITEERIIELHVYQKQIKIVVILFMTINPVIQSWSWWIHHCYWQQMMGQFKSADANFGHMNCWHILMFDWEPSFYIKPPSPLTINEKNNKCFNQNSYYLYNVLIYWHKSASFLKTWIEESFFLISFFHCMHCSSTWYLLFH